MLGKDGWDLILAVAWRNLMIFQIFLAKDGRFVPMYKQEPSKDQLSCPLIKLRYC